ncbi:MAG: DUF2442 domain-containing protein [Pyrinomonadaceae bacterium]
MNYLPQVVAARRIRGFVIATRFDDGTEKHVDISQWFKGPVFRPLKDSKFFKRFFIEAGTLAWPNGVDIAPEALYQAADVRPIQEKKRKPSTKPHARSRKPRSSTTDA